MPKEYDFLIIGGGPSERIMRKIFRRHGVRKRVHFAGMLKGRALVHAYHAMDVFAFASKSETQGIVVTEAMAAGLPVVALDAPGVREVLQDRVNGRLVGLESREKFADALLWCASRSIAQRNEIKKNALETAHRFSTEICAGKALAVYEKARRHPEYSFSEVRWNQWKALLGRFETEFEMLLNFGRAAGAALVKTTVSERGFL